MRDERPPHGEDIENEAPCWVYQASISPTGVNVLDTWTLFPLFYPGGRKACQDGAVPGIGLDPQRQGRSPIEVAWRKSGGRLWRHFLGPLSAIHEEQDGHAHGQTVGHLLQYQRAPAVRNFAVNLDAAVNRAGVHD